MRAAGMRSHLQVHVSERDPQSRRVVAVHRVRVRPGGGAPHSPRPHNYPLEVCMIIDHVDSSFHATHIFVTPVYNTNSRLQVEAGPFCAGTTGGAQSDALKWRFSKTCAQSLLSVLYLSVARLLQIDVLEDGLVRKALEVAVTLLLQVRARKVWRRIVFELLLA